MSCGHVDLVVGVEPRPLVHQLTGDVDHARQVAAHAGLAEGRHQDVVRAPPHRVRGLAEEQPGGRGTPGRHQPGAELFVEAVVVADLREQVGAGHDHPGGAGDDELVDGSELPGPPDQRVDRVGVVQVQQISQDGHAVRAGELVEGDGCGHASSAVARSGPPGSVLGERECGAPPRQAESPYGLCPIRARGSANPGRVVTVSR